MRPLSKIILDLDATDDPVHGEQEGRFFHGHYEQWCPAVTMPASVVEPSAPPTRKRTMLNRSSWPASENLHNCGLMQRIRSVGQQ
jgi:Transposase DDE domain group 1